MLRTLGIPARVAVGYTGGRFDTGIDRYVVLDRDAHSWVEVYFPGQGWLPFDPTPGRSAPNPASVSSPDYAPSRFEVNLGGLVGRAVAPGTTEAPPLPQPETPAPAAASSGDTAAAPAPAEGGGGGGWRWVLLVPLGLLFVPRRRADGAPLAGAHPRRRARARDRRRPGARVVPAAVRVGAARDGLGHGARRGGPGADGCQPDADLRAGRPRPLRGRAPRAGGGGGGVAGHRPPCARSAARRRCVAA